jgi:hypothetical protein
MEKQRQKARPTHHSKASLRQRDALKEMPLVKKVGVLSVGLNLDPSPIQKKTWLRR